VLITDAGLSPEAHEQLEQETRRLVIADDNADPSAAAPAVFDAVG